jgi:hypothetical protein
MTDNLTPEEIKRLKAILNPPRGVRIRIRIAFVILMVFIAVVVIATLINLAQPIHTGVFEYTLR